MERVLKHLITIFYFPLVVLTFTFVFFVLADFASFFTNSGPKPVITTEDFVDGELWAYFNKQRIEAPRTPLMVQVGKDSQVLSATAGEKWITVNLSSQTLTAFEPNGNVFIQVPISSGLWAPTPTGTFRVWTKLRYTKMSGGSQALGTYYYLPNVPCTQYFYKGYGLHGTYWHNNFGHPMSHGCVNMRTDDACQLFEWTSWPSQGQPGTKVIVHY